MQLYLAPMEGVTGYVYRNAYHRYFYPMDKYFTPFITNKKLSYKEINDIIPENNKEMNVVPQILTNRADIFLSIAGELKSYGYTEVNLNLGCPSGTVVSKYRGAGFLALPEELDLFLENIFSSCPVKISIKTRIGKDSAVEWERILSIYEKYPLEELIIHPRIQRDYYRNTPNLAAFQKAVEESRHVLCYNGDINTKAAFENMKEQFPGVEKVMLGRGILANPGLSGEIAGESGQINKAVLRAFHDDILSGYCAIMSGDRNTLFKMKELWSYLGTRFLEPQRYLKKIKKAERLAEYEAAVNMLFRERELL